MGQSGGAQSQEGGGTYVKAWPLEGGWRERRHSVWLVRDLVCVCGCEWSVCAVGDQLEVDRDQTLQVLRSSATFGDRPLPKCVSGGSYSQGQAARGRRVQFVGLEWASCTEGQAGSWSQTTLLGRSWRWQVGYGRGRRKGEEREGSVCSELSAGSRHGHLTIGA